jgi:hypothetical protein
LLLADRSGNALKLRAMECDRRSSPVRASAAPLPPPGSLNHGGTPPILINRRGRMVLWADSPATITSSIQMPLGAAARSVCSMFQVANVAAMTVSSMSLRTRQRAGWPAEAGAYRRAAAQSVGCGPAG